MNHHTPGPLRAEKQIPLASRASEIIIQAGTEIIATVHHLGRDRNEEWKANGKLFAAAPDMLTALEAIVFQVCQGSVMERDACITAARAAIAKAKGGAA